MNRIKKKQLLGPFSQIVTMKGLPPAGPVSDSDLEIISKGGIFIEDGIILESGPFERLKKQTDPEKSELFETTKELVLMPGFIDAHTHICYAGSRASEYAKRLAGKTYLEIAKQGGGIMNTVRETRRASLEELTEDLKSRCTGLLAEGITTCEVKSGYGLTVQDELKMLRAIKTVNDQQNMDLISTALPAHVCPPEFKNPAEYIQMIIRELLPQIARKNLSNRVDIYVDDGAFDLEQGRIYLDAAQELGFAIAIHADQFRVAGSQLAVEYKAMSADHLEVSGRQHFELLAKNRVAGIVLPGASLGLGLPFAPARQMLDSGMTVAIASDWNPGSAPMGDLLVQACLIGAYEKLTMAETLAGITVRAAMALQCPDRGSLEAGKIADMAAFPCRNYQDIIYRQGKMKPDCVWKNGSKVK